MHSGKTDVWRHGFIVQDGEPDRAWIEAGWRDDAKPAEITIGPVKA